MDDKEYKRALLKSCEIISLVRFSVVRFANMAIVAIALAVVRSAKIRSDAIDDIVEEALGCSVARIVTTLTPEDLAVAPTGERYDCLHQCVKDSVVSDRTARNELLASDGTVIYSNDSRQVVDQFPTKKNL